MLYSGIVTEANSCQRERENESESDSARAREIYLKSAHFKIKS